MIKSLLRDAGLACFKPLSASREVSIGMQPKDYRSVLNVAFWIAQFLYMYDVIDNVVTRLALNSGIGKEGCG